MTEPEQHAQAILDAQGYLIISSDVPEPVPSIKRDVITGRQGSFVADIAIIAEATREEWEAQIVNAGGIVIDRPGWNYFYKCKAE